MKTKTEQKIDELKVVDPELWDRIQSYFREMYPDEAPPYANRPQLIGDIISPGSGEGRKTPDFRPGM